MPKNNYTEEEKFDLVEQKLIGNYNDIMNQMGMVSKMIKANPENKDLKDLLYSLAENATKIISTQISFTHTYGDERYKDRIIENLMKKRQELLSEVASELNISNSNAKAR